MRFSKLVLDANGQPVETNIREISQSAILACPHAILVADHYRPDGSCRCNDPEHAEMRAWGYEWSDGLWRSGDDADE